MKAGTRDNLINIAEQRSTPRHSDTTKVFWSYNAELERLKGDITPSKLMTERGACRISRGQLVEEIANVDGWMDASVSC